jgi:hypothetical protein
MVAMLCRIAVPQRKLDSAEYYILLMSVRRIETDQLYDRHGGNVAACSQIAKPSVGTQTVIQALCSILIVTVTYI